MTLVFHLYLISCIMHTLTYSKEGTKKSVFNTTAAIISYILHLVRYPLLCCWLRYLSIESSLAEAIMGTITMRICVANMAQPQYQLHYLQILSKLVGNRTS